MRLAAQHALGDQHLGGGPERVAGDAQALGELRLAQAAAGLELAVEDQLAQHVGGGVDGRDGVQMQVAGRVGTVLRSFHVLHSSTIRQLRFCAIFVPRGGLDADHVRKWDWNDGIRSLSAEPGQFAGRGVLVTGGASGIGLAIAGEFLARGARVLVADRDRDGPRPAAGPPRRRRPPPDGRGRPRRAGRPGAPRGPGRRRCSAAWTRWSTTRASCARPRRSRSRSPSGTSSSPSTCGPSSSSPSRLRRAMAERGGGAVVSIASVNALRTEAPEAHYNATKAGIVSVMRSFATELGHRGVRFNCVAPGETVGAAEASGLHGRRPRPDAALPPAGPDAPGRAAGGDGEGRLLPRLRRGVVRQRADDRRRRRRARRRLVRHREPPAGARADGRDRPGCRVSEPR